MLQQSLEVRCRSKTSAALGNNSSYSAQLLHGTDYWRTVLDGASGIDIYGHNGVSVCNVHHDEQHRKTHVQTK
jgi:hypothetical protein